RETVVAELEQRPASARLQLELDRAGARWDRVFLPVLRLPAKGVHQAPGRVQLDELSACDVSANHVDPVPPPGPRVEPGLAAEPARQLLGVDQELPERLRARRDLDVALDSGFGCRLHAATPL